MGHARPQPPLVPQIDPQIRLSDHVARGQDRPFGPDAQASARARGLSEPDIAEQVAAVVEGHTLPQDLSLRLDDDAGTELRQREGLTIPASLLVRADDVIERDLLQCKSPPLAPRGSVRRRGERPLRELKQTANPDDSSRRTCRELQLETAALTSKDAAPRKASCRSAYSGYRSK